MRSKLQLKPTLTRKARLLMTMVALPLMLSCAIPIHDQTFCALVPGNMGAVCDGFLTANQQILDEVAWQALERSWNAKGWAVECTTSDAVGNLKAEIEELCSRTQCDYPMVKKAIDRAAAKMNKISQVSLMFQFH